MPNLSRTDIQTFPCLSTAAIVAFRALEFETTNKGNVALPGGALTTRFVGVSAEKQSGGNNVAVYVAGQAVIESDGSAVINPGDNIIYVITTGRAKSQAFAQGAAAQYLPIGKCIDDVQIPATAGALVTILLTPYITEAA